MTDLGDWRVSIHNYLRDSSSKVDISVRQVAFKYSVISDELYCLSAWILIKKG